jgi:hypothetical protein
MKNLNFTKKYTDQTTRLSIPITMRSLKWIVQGVLNLQCDIRKIAYNLMNSPITLEWKFEISPWSIQTVRPSIPITLWNLKWIGLGVLKLERDMWNGRMDGIKILFSVISSPITAKVKIVKNERDPPLFTSKQLIKF